MRRVTQSRRLWLLLCSSLCLSTAHSSLTAPAYAASGPTLELNLLQVPPSAAAFEKFLRRTLVREAKRMDWGASAGSTVQYRFVLQRLDVSVDGDVLTVHCAALGRLPKGQSAKSQLSFGGDPKQQQKLTERVLTIVVRGVLTRLSELERERRRN